jgi:hypothetical protein
MTDEEIAFAMVTVSGFVDGVSAAQLELVADGPELFKNIRSHIAASVPHWPTGLPDWNAFIHLAAAAQSEGDNSVRLATQRRRRVTEAGPRRERRLARRATRSSSSRRSPTQRPGSSRSSNRSNPHNPTLPRATSQSRAAKSNSAAQPLSASDHFERSPTCQ